MHDSSPLFDDASARLPSGSSTPDRREIAAELFRLAGVCARLGARVEGRRKNDLLAAVIEFPTLKRDALAQLDAAKYDTCVAFDGPERAEIEHGSSAKRKHVANLAKTAHGPGLRAEIEAIEPPSFEALHRAQHFRETKPAFCAKLAGDLARMG